MEGGWPNLYGAHNSAMGGCRQETCCCVFHHPVAGACLLVCYGTRELRKEAVDGILWYIVNKARQVSGYYWAKPRNGHVGWAVNHLFVHEESGPGGGQHTSTGSAVEDDVEWPRRLANRRFRRRRAVARGRLRPDSYLCFPFPLPLQNCIQKPLATSRTCDVHRCLVFSDSLSGLLTSGVQPDPKSMQLEGYLRI